LWCLHGVKPNCQEGRKFNVVPNLEHRFTASAFFLFKTCRQNSVLCPGQQSNLPRPSSVP
jgi:hypothetical protein